MIGQKIGTFMSQLDVLRLGEEKLRLGEPLRQGEGLVRLRSFFNNL